MEFRASEARIGEIHTDGNLYAGAMYPEHRPGYVLYSRYWLAFSPCLLSRRYSVPRGSPDL